MIEWIVTSSVLILLMILLRIIIKNRINPRLRYALWGLVLLRLLIPGTLWESRASVMTPVAAQETYQAVERIPRYVRTQPDGWVEIGHANGWTSIPEAKTANGEPVVYGWPERSEAPNLEALRKQVNLRDAFLLVWLGGAAVVGLFLLAVNLRFDRNLKKNRRTLEQYRGRWVFTMESLPTPCLFGLFRPGIYLTAEVAADEGAKAHVLAHEYAHFRQGDHLWATLRGVCLAVHWYNPLVWLAAYLSRRDCELSCDEGAVRLLGEERRADYGRTLVGLVARRTTPKDLACCATTMTGGKSALKERIALLVKHPRTTVWMACIVAAACIVFAVCTFTGAAAEEADEPEPDAPEEDVLPADDEDLPDLADLPTELDWDEPIWLLEQIRPSGEEIAVYQDAKTGVNYLRKGNRLQKLEARNLYDRQRPRGIQLIYRDLDGDGAEELVICQTTFTSDTGGWEPLVCEWDGQRWTEHRPEGIVLSLVRDFRENHEITTIWSDPGMGEMPGPSIMAVEWNGLSAAFEVSSWLLKTGGTLVCDLDERQYTYYVGQDGSIELVIYGEASYADSPVKDSRQFWYACPVVYRADGTFAIGPGALNTRPPEDLPTEPMDLSRPAEEQGPWLLLAETPGYDVALYRSAWDDQHVYLRVTNMSFQAFERDLSGMELLPTLERWDDDAYYAVRALYRRYEGTYFNGTSYEPGVVAEQAIYLWSSAEKFWAEAYINPSRPVQLQTEDLPAIADLPTRLVRPGTPEARADMWRIGELPDYGISAYYEQSTDRIWLLYGDVIQEVEGMTVCMPQMLLPELHFEDLDGDGGRELIAISQETVGTGVSRELLTVYEWDDGGWSGQTFDVDWLVDTFNGYLTYQFYDSGLAYIRNSFIGEDLLLDLSEVRNGLWTCLPDFCGLYELQVNYAWQDGQLTLTLGGVILDISGYDPRAHTFDYICPVVYTDNDGFGYFDYFECWFGAMRSDYAIEPRLPTLTGSWRTVLEKTLAECSGNGSDAFAVYDVNRDGKDELIVCWMPEGGTSASRGTSIYDTNGVERFHGHGELTFYSNGAISEPWSHNQGLACAIFPYDLYTCDFISYGIKGFRYSKVGSARARSNDVPNFEDVAYADLDGDGMVYYIGEDAYTEENPVDNAVYEAWLDKYLGGEHILPIQYFRLAEENISKYRTNK